MFSHRSEAESELELCRKVVARTGIELDCSHLEDPLQKITPELIRLMAMHLRGLKVSAERAAQLANEVARVNGAARAAALDNELNDEPSRFAATLAQLKP